MRRRISWSDERRERQRQHIYGSRPWEKSTGPRTQKGKARSSQNARRPAEVDEVEAYLRLLSLRRERDAPLLGGRSPTKTRMEKLLDEIEALERSLDPDSGFAKFLANSEESDEDHFDLM